MLSHVNKQGQCETLRAESLESRACRAPVIGCCLFGFILMAFTGTLAASRAFSMASCSLGTSSSSARPSASSTHLSTCSHGLPSTHPGKLLGVPCDEEDWEPFAAIFTLLLGVYMAKITNMRMCWASCDDRLECDLISKGL